MLHVLRTFPTLLRTEFATMLQYRGEVLLWAVWGVVFPAVSMAMWTAAARGGALADFSKADIQAYFLLTMIVGHLTVSWDIYEIGFEVRSGALSPKLLRPMLPVWDAIAANIAYKVVTVIVLTPIWIGFAWLFAIRPGCGPGDVAPGILALAAAAALSYVWGYVLATSAFFITKTEAFGDLYFAVLLLLGGRFAAIEWLPGPLQALTWAAPFRWMAAFPIELWMGRLSGAEAAVGLLWQIGWFAVGLLVLRWTWTTGVRRYGAVGA